MRVASSSSVAAVTTTLMVWLAPLVASISVPTGKLTPITPARPTLAPINPHAPAVSAPVVEYTQEHPEPPPLDPSYVPQTFNYFDTLSRHHVYYVPVRYRNFNAAPNNYSPVSNNIDYEPPQKYFDQTLGKNVGYKRAGPLVDWRGQYQPQQYQYNNQYDGRYNNPYTHYSVQPTPLQQQQQRYEVVSTQTAPVTTGLPQPQTSQPTANYTPTKTSYVTGKGSYDVTGKGGSKSDTEYYSKDDWSKKSYPKKASATPGKFAGHKF